MLEIADVKHARAHTRTHTHTHQDKFQKEKNPQPSSATLNWPLSTSISEKNALLVHIMIQGLSNF